MPKLRLQWEDYPTHSQFRCAGQHLEVYPQQSHLGLIKGFLWIAGKRSGVSRTREWAKFRAEAAVYANLLAMAGAFGLEVKPCEEKAGSAKS